MTAREELWQVIADVRDAAPRRSDDASTDDIVDALMPLVDRLRAEAAAEALAPVLSLAADYDDGSEWGSIPHPGYSIRERILLAARAGATS